MKLISGLVRPDRVDQIKAALEKVHVVGMTVTEVRDHWPQDHGTTVWKGHEYKLNFSIKMAIELVVHDDDVHDVVKVIINTARTGRWVMDTSPCCRSSTAATFATVQGTSREKVTRAAAAELG